MYKLGKNFNMRCYMEDELPSPQKRNTFSYNTLVENQAATMANIWQKEGHDKFLYKVTADNLNAIFYHPSMFRHFFLMEHLHILHDTFWQQ